MNKRQQRIVDLLRQVGWAARLKQKHDSCVWIITGQWPNQTRVKALCRGVHGLVMMGMIERRDFGWRPEWKLSPKAGFIPHPLDSLDPS